MTFGDVDPVGIGEIAHRAGVRPDTAQKWLQRHEDFPAAEPGAVSGRRVWMWGAVRRWLEDTGRLPRTLRYREENNGRILLAQTLDGDDRWRTVARFVAGDLGDWTAQPGPYALENSATRAEAQAWAQRMLDGWDAQRAAWVREHPDEPMPAHLIGTSRALHADEAVVDVSEEGSGAGGEGPGAPLLTMERKLRLVAEWEAADAAGREALLRREGIERAQIAAWRVARDALRDI
ncbi:hypothetical protein [Rhizomonospora bruguierae]|uniref:hypothetical protein n=1 Tax=Rhizomonospora bruguierae TaxID=1581705 RepID=UPI001BCD79CB|nr:hypothetical protein [Micromonospora sp. NBRC 107566]